MKIMVNFMGLSGFDSQSLYAHSLLRALVSNKPANLELVVFCDKKFAGILQNKSEFKLRAYKIKGWLSRIFFINFVLPFVFFLHKYDYVYNPNPIFPIWLSGKSLITVHDLAYFLFKKDEPFLSGVFMRFMYRRGRRSWRVIAISNSVRENLLSVGYETKKILVVHSARPFESLDFNLPEVWSVPEGDYLVYVGMYRSRKNLEFLIKSLALMPGVDLVLVGSVVRKSEVLLNLADRLGIRNRIIFTGLISSESKNKIIKNSLALVFPSLYEGFGFPILEAQYLGVPVITSDISVFREVGGKSVLYFDPKDESSLSQQVSMLYQDQKKRRELTQAGLQNLERFSWSRTAIEILKQFN